MHQRCPLVEKKTVVRKSFSLSVFFCPLAPLTSRFRLSLLRNRYLSVREKPHPEEMLQKLNWNIYSGLDHKYLR